MKVNNIITILCALFLFLFITSSIKSCELEDSIELKDKEITEKKNQIKERERVIEQLDKEVKESEAKIAELEETVKKREKDIADAKRKLQEQKDKVRKFTPSEFEEFYEQRYTTSPEEVKSTDTELSLQFSVVEKVTEDILEKDFLKVENFNLMETILDQHSIINEKDNIIGNRNKKIEEKDKNLADMGDINNLLENNIKKLEQDVKTQKKKTFWGIVQGVGAGILGGIIISNTL